MPDPGRGWVWDGGRACLDLVNTLRDRHTAEGRELLGAPGDLVVWCRAAGLLEPARGRGDVDTLAAARELREAVDVVALGTSSDAGERRTPAAVETINRWARDVPTATLRLVRGRLTVASPRPARTVAAALALIAQDAVDLVADEDAATRVCASSTCGLRFVDRSPTHNRQWCSMRRCGNREKARQHYARGRAAAGRRGESAE